MNAHLRDGEHGKAEGNSRRPEQRRIGDPERRGREDDSENQSDRVDEHAVRRPLFPVGQCWPVSRRAIKPSVSHGRTPIR